MPKERLDGSTANMRLNRNSSNVLKFVLLILYFASLCSLSSGSSLAKPRFRIENRACKQPKMYIHPVNSFGTVEKDPVQIWEGFHDGSIYGFEPVDGKWGHLVHLHSGNVWHTVDNSINNGAKIILQSVKDRNAQFSLDIANGFIQHRGGSYVHMQRNNCKNGDKLQLWDDIHGNMRWNFIDV